MTSPRNATTTSRGRRYTWPPTGEQFDSVTTIIGAGVPKPALLPWASKKAAEFVVEEWEHFARLLGSGKATDRKRAIDDIKGAPWRDRDAAADKGTVVHDWAEKIALDPAYEAVVPEELKGHVNSFRQFVADYEVHYEASEFTVYSRTNKYAGTGDFLARFGKFPEWGLCLGDYKTARSGIFGEIALQLAALRYADFIGLPDNSEFPMPDIDTCVGVHIKADGYKVYTVDTGDGIFADFLHAREVGRFVNEISKSVLHDAPYVAQESPA